MTRDYRARLIVAREKLGLPRREMARRLLTPRATYEQWEAGTRRTPGVAVIAAESQRRERTSVADIQRAADGTLSAREIAEKLGTDLNTTKSLVAVLKKTSGIAVRKVRNIKWYIELERAQARNETVTQLATRLHVSLAAVMSSEKKHHIKLRRAYKRRQLAQ